MLDNRNVDRCVLLLDAICIIFRKTSIYIHDTRIDVGHITLVTKWEHLASSKKCFLLCISVSHRSDFHYYNYLLLLLFHLGKDELSWNRDGFRSWSQATGLRVLWCILIGMSKDTQHYMCCVFWQLRHYNLDNRCCFSDRNTGVIDGVSDQYGIVLSVVIDAGVELELFSLGAGTYQGKQIP